MKKTEYLYNINVDVPSGKYHSIFSSPHNFDLEFNLEQLWDDMNIKHSFETMIFSDMNICGTDPEDFLIKDFNILSKVDFKLSYNNFLPDNLFKSLNWFNKAIMLYDNYIEEFEEPVLLIKHIEEAYTNKIFRNWDFNNLKETSYCGHINRNIKERTKKIQHAETVLKCILKEINIDRIYEYDDIIQEYIESHANEIKEVVQWRYDESEEIKILRGGLGHKPIIVPPKSPVDLEDYKIILLTHIGKLVSEIRFIFAELLNSIMDYKPFDTIFYNSLFFDSLEDVFITFKIRLIKEKKKCAIENQEYSMNLAELQNEKENNYQLNDKDTIMSTLVSSFKKREKAQTILNEIDEHYYISNSIKFEKRKLAIIAYILQHCEIFNNMSYETFKKNICWYFGKENVSMKPNKIKEEAIQEYYQKEFLYKKHNIKINSHP